MKMTVGNLLKALADVPPEIPVVFQANVAGEADEPGEEPGYTVVRQMDSSSLSLMEPSPIRKRKLQALTPSHGTTIPERQASCPYRSEFLQSA